MPTDLPDGYTGQQPEKPTEPTNWTGLIGLAIICATIVALCWMFTR